MSAPRRRCSFCEKETVVASSLVPMRFGMSELKYECTNCGYRFSLLGEGSFWGMGALALGLFLLSTWAAFDPHRWRSETDRLWGTLFIYAICLGLLSLLIKNRRLEKKNPTVEDRAQDTPRE